MVTLILNQQRARTLTTTTTELSRLCNAEAHLPLLASFLFGNKICEISTNCDKVLQAATESFAKPDKRGTAPDLRMKLWVDERPSIPSSDLTPYVRALNHLVFAGFNSTNSALLDLEQMHIVGRFSKAVALDRSCWKNTIFPVLLSVAAGPLGVAELHCACVEKNGNGLLLAGASGSGKSSLSVLLAKRGFRFLSDDRTCCSFHNRKLTAWAMPTPLKMRSEAGAWLDELRQLRPHKSKTGEMEFRLDPTKQLHLRRARECQPRLLVFLEQHAGAGFQVRQISRRKATALLAKDLMAEDLSVTESQLKTISKIVETPCRKLVFGGPPQEIADRLSRYFETFHTGDGQPRTGNRSRSRGHYRSPRSGARPDVLRRFTPTPRVVNFGLMGHAVHLESNNPAFLRMLHTFIERYQPAPRRSPAFHWRIVCSSEPRMNSTQVPFAAFLHSGYHYVNIGHRSFLAVDLAKREGIGWLAEHFLDDDPRCMHHLGFDFLLPMTAEALGLSFLPGACVGSGKHSALIFGPPNSGKTTSSYLAATMGLEFHADQNVFLDTHGSRLRVWGDPFPAAFRPETLSFLPELRDSTTPHSYANFTFHYFNKRPFQQRRARPVNPVFSVFLARGASQKTCLTALSRAGLRAQIRKTFFSDPVPHWKVDPPVLRYLATIPAYELRYHRDPAVAAVLIKQLLNATSR